MLNQRTALVDDIEEDPRIPTDVYRPTFVQSLLMVPIRKKDPIGAIGNYWAEQHRPTQEETETIQALAEIAGVAMENVSVHNELDKRVKERTSQLEAFSYSVAHDLKNPLAGMEMRLNSLEADEEASSENIQEVTEDLREAIDRMKGMIDGLLELSCLGDDGVKRSWTDMEGTVRSIAKKTKEEEGHGPIELRIGELPMEYVDPTLFQRVWQNLLSNAIKFSSEVENPRIEIGMEEQKEERIYWIRDNGKGFRSDKAPELFKAFRKMDSGDNYPGSGIGLSMVQQIIYRHGGTIWAEGEKGKGATFFFSLPWDTDEERISTPPN
jgi:light-regulated signal transduction histidine kinase (bacteriophytochrome)